MYMYLKVSFEKCVSENLIILDVTIIGFMLHDSIILNVISPRI